MSVVKLCSLALAAAWIASGTAFAQEGEWTVRKTSGEVWTGQGVLPVSLGQETVLKPGDTVTTGRNGRVLLVRGQESILIAPNSVVGIPVKKKDGLATTISQQAGSILLEVEKQNNPHFEVETPYLAAVVKGTQFRVSVTATGTRVDVQRGQVEVVDFKTGQIAQVLPGQGAQSFAHGSQGLSLTGSGTFKPIEHGAPRIPTLEQIKVPKSGITAPRMLDRGRGNQAGAQRASAHGVGKPASQDAHVARGTRSHGAVRISAPLGDVKLNFHKVTHGLARGTAAATGNGRRAVGKEMTIWSGQDGKSGAGAGAIAGNSDGNGAAVSAAGIVSGAAASGAASASGASAATTTVAAGSSGNGNANGNGNGNSVNGNSGNGNGNGNSGNGSGSGNSGNGNGNGNSGSGSGNSNGHGKSKK